MALHQKEFQRLAYMLNCVQPAQDWNRKIGIEYWMVPALLSQGVGAFSGGVLGSTSNGWVNTGTILGVAGSAADFPAAAEIAWYSSNSAQQAADRGTPAHFAIDTAGDLLNSPALFGDPTHMAIAAEKIGMEELPAFIILDTWSAFTDVANNETASGLGFVEDGGAASVANDHFACFFSDGTNFKLRSGAATSSALATADTNFHRFRIIIDRIDQLAKAWIDNVKTAPLGSIAIEADELPVSVGAGVLASTGANFIKFGPTRVRYAWSQW